MGGQREVRSGQRGRGAGPGVVLLAGLGGAALVYLFEPDAGRRHRAVLRDKTVSLWRRGRRRVRRLSRRGTHTLRGQWGRITRPGHSDEPVDSVTLTQRVESEVFRDPAIPKGRINVNAENGVIELRGQLDSAEQIERVVARVRRVPGVRDVANLMHLPGTPAPNKEAAIRASRGTMAMPREQPQQPRYE
jgi:osmotically-inducible protein OsmY